jgi:putative tryptophan/tyrosine transport system substrate-binding protein
VRRREFIGLFGGAAAVWPLVAGAQQSTVPTIGFLNGGSPEGYAANLAGFLQGLKEAGYVDGQNVRIEYRWAEGHYDRLPAMLADLVHRQVTHACCDKHSCGPRWVSPRNFTWRSTHAEPA